MRLSVTHVVKASLLSLTQSMWNRRTLTVIRIFHNSDSALRLIGAMLAEQNEVWLERRYLDMDDFAEWVASRNANTECDNIITLAG
jgi:hypothetical protein